MEASPKMRLRRWYSCHQSCLVVAIPEFVAQQPSLLFALPSIVVIGDVLPPSMPFLPLTVRMLTVEELELFIIADALLPAFAPSMLEPLSILLFMSLAVVSPPLFQLLFFFVVLPSPLEVIFFPSLRLV